MDKNIHRRLKAWLDHELPPDAARRVEAALAGSPALRDEVDDYRWLSRAIREGGDGAAPVPDVDRILSRARMFDRSEERVVRVLRRVVYATAAVMVLSVSWIAASLADAQWRSKASAQGTDGLVELIDQQERLAVLALRDRDG